MWKASAGHNVNVASNDNDDDDWETEADFEVYKFYIIILTL